jgi:rod shape-determining protein MreD
MIPVSPLGRLVAVMAGAAVLQFAVLSQLRVVGVVPDVLVLLAVLGGLVGGRHTGASTGFAAGITADLLLPGLPFGLSTLVFTVVGYLAGWYATASVDHSTRADVLVAGIGTVFAVVAFVIAARLLSDAVPLAGRLPVTLVVMALWSMLLAVPVRAALRWVWFADARNTSWAR